MHGHTAGSAELLTVKLLQACERRGTGHALHWSQLPGVDPGPWPLLLLVHRQVVARQVTGVIVVAVVRKLRQDDVGPERGGVAAGRGGRRNDCRGD